jgi:hypothetical protein
MSITSFVLSSLLSLVALVDTNWTAPSCINSSVVQRVTVEGGKPERKEGFEKLKERWLGSCGPLSKDTFDQMSLVQGWFKSRGLRTSAVEVSYNRDGSFEVSPQRISLPLQLSGDSFLTARLFTKSLLAQNKAGGAGIGFEVAADLVMADVFGAARVLSRWKLDGLGLSGEFVTLARDCEKNLVPPEKKSALCSSENLGRHAGEISPWALRWTGIEAMTAFSDIHLDARVHFSRELARVAGALASDGDLDEAPKNLSQLDGQIKKVFWHLDSSLDSYRSWMDGHGVLQVVLSERSADARLASPLPSGTLILGFDSGFHLVTGEKVDLSEAEVFGRAKRSAFMGCRGPTVSEILQYAGADKRLLFIENCRGEKPIDLRLYAKYGASGVEDLNPHARFLQFHQPSVKLALEWGLSPRASFGFTRDNGSTPEKFRRLFGWNMGAPRARLSAPIPVVELFNARRDEKLTLIR